MADEFKDDEYHFSDSGESDAFDEEAVSSTVSPTSTLTHLKKGVLGLIGAFVFVLFAYQFIMPHFKEKMKVAKKENSAPVRNVSQKKSEPKIQKTPKKVVQVVPKPQYESAPAPQNNYPTYNAPSASPTVVTKEVISPEMQSKINRLSRSNRQAKQEISELNDKLGKMDSHFSNAADKLTTLNRNIQLLTQQMAMQQAELKVLKAEQAKKKKEEMLGLAKKKSKYFVQAIIPGRAWLMSERGATVTVAKGVTLKDYGRILSIDARAGEVTTSSGKTIRFNPDDI